MLYQKTPANCTKLIFVNEGSIVDVVLDMRLDSDRFGQFYSVKISEDDLVALFLPPGFAHGFLSLCDGSKVSYLQREVHDASADTGIRYDSFGFAWPCLDPIVSDRDCQLQRFNKLIYQ